ncbi:MAG: diphthamide biosynthesis enzyme Dph2 [Candidatus Diapherotrites archaeon]
MSLLQNADLQKIQAEIKKRKAKLVGVQVPEGMKTELETIIEWIEKKTKAKTISFVEPCYGACDTADDKAKMLGCDLLVHFGHSQIYNPSIPALFIPVRYEVDVQKIAPKIAEFLSGAGVRTVALGTTIQYANSAPQLQKELAKKGIKVLLGKGKGRAKERAQVLGCNYSAVRAVEKKVDALLYFGDGNFHALGMAYSSKKRTFAADPRTGNVHSLEKEKEAFERKRYAAIALAQQAKIFVVIVGLKKGQLQKSKALKAKELIEKNGRTAFLVGTDVVKEEFLLGLEFDCIVNTACPRITSDDGMHFKKPVISLSELEVVLGEKKKAELDEIF